MTRGCMAESCPSGHWPCPKCGADYPGEDQPDPCFGGMMPGVQSACCGHGAHPGWHITFKGGPHVHGPGVLEVMYTKSRVEDGALVLTMTEDQARRWETA